MALADGTDPAAAQARAVVRELGGGPELEEVVQTLLQLGVSREAVLKAHARGRVEDAIFDPVLDPARGERTVSARRIEADGGLTVSETQLVALSFGLPVPQPDEPYFTPAEAMVLRRFGELREIWPPEVYLQIARVYGQALGHIAQTEANLFRLHVAGRLQAAGESARRTLPAVHEAFAQLLPLADPMLLGVHRRRLEHELAQAAVREAELRTPEGVLPGAVEVSFLFCDLKDFTAYTDEHGDAAAGEAIERFAAVVTQELGPHGHVVKMLGDGFMLSYTEPAAAVASFIRIAGRIRAEGPLAIHASAHHGVALYREGDYFGRCVNLAARLLALAGRDELIASQVVVQATADRYAWEPLGAAHLRGASEPVAIHRLVGPSPDSGTQPPPAGG